MPQGVVQGAAIQGASVHGAVHGAVHGVGERVGQIAGFRHVRACPACARRMRDRSAYMRKLAANYESLPAVDSLELARRIRGLRSGRARLGGLVSRLLFA